MSDILLSAISVDSASQKLFLFSGEFTTTIKTSLLSSGFGSSSLRDIDTDDKDTFSADAGTVDKLYRTSGRFSTTVNDSLATGEVETSGITWADPNTIWSEGPSDFIFQTSGKFTSTIKDSIDLSSITDATPQTVSYDGIHPSFATGSFPSELREHTMFRISGIFSTTVKDSLQSFGLTAHGFNGTDTLVANTLNRTLFKYSGQFTSTIKTTKNLTSLISVPTGIATDRAFVRMGGTDLNGDTISSTSSVSATLSFATLSISGSLSAVSSATADMTFSTLAIVGTVTAVSTVGPALLQIPRQFTLGTDETSNYPDFVDFVKEFKRVPTTTPQTDSRVWNHNAANSFGAAIRQIELELGIRPRGNVADVASLMQGIQPVAPLTASDPFNAAVQTWNDVAVKFIGTQINVTLSLAASPSYLIDYQVDGIPTFGVTSNGFSAFGNIVPKANIHGSDDTILGIGTSANLDGDIAVNETNVWINESNDNITFRVRYSDGSYKTGVLVAS